MNETLNATLNSTAVNQTLTQTVSWADRAFEGIWSFWGLLPLAFERLFALVKAPFLHPEMLWIITPLFLTFIVLEFYLDRHRDEELGWAAAVANSLVLCIVALDLLRHSFPGETPWGVLKVTLIAGLTEATLPIVPQVMLMILLLGAIGVGVTLLNYYHLLPKQLAFMVSGHPPVNFLAFFAIVIVYTTGTEHAIPLDTASVTGGVFLYFILNMLVFWMTKLTKQEHKKKKF